MSDQELVPRIIYVTLAGRSYEWTAPVRRKAREMRASMKPVMDAMPSALMEKIGEFREDTQPEDVFRADELMALIPQLAAFSIQAADWIAKHNKDIPQAALDDATDLEMVSAFFAVFGMLTDPFVPKASSTLENPTPAPNAEPTNE